MYSVIVRANCRCSSPPCRACCLAPYRSITYDLGTKNESFEWFDCVHAGEDCFKLMSEKVDMRKHQNTRACEWLGVQEGEGEEGVTCACQLMLSDSMVIGCVL